MSEPSKIRLVRCPNCENLLPELADYSVYQCGGCGAVLRAEKKTVEDDTTLVLKTDEKNYEESENFASCGEGEVKISSGYEINDAKSNGSCSSLEISAVKSEKPNVSVAEEEADEAQIRSEKSEQGELGNREDDSKPSKTEFFPRKPRFMRYPEAEEGPSNYQMRMKSVEGNKVEFFEEDQAAQFLRKLDELKDQLDRSREMNQNSSNVSYGRRFGFPDDPYLPEPVPYPNPNRYERFRNNGSLRSLVHETDPYFTGHYQEPFETTYPYKNLNHNNSSLSSCSCCVQYPNHFTNNPFPENHNHFKARVCNLNHSRRWAAPPDDEFLRRCPPIKGVVPPTTVGKTRCLPVSGGAPSVTCHNCLKLLQVPKRIFSIDNEGTRMKMKCGACSTMLALRVVDKKLYVSVSEDTNTTPNGVNCRVSGLNFLSEDYYNLCYDFHSMGHEGFVAEMTSVPSGSLYSLEDDDSPDSIKQSNSSELPPPSAGSPPKDPFDYSNKHNIVNRLGKGNRSWRSDCEVGFQTNVASRQNSMKVASVQEYLNAETVGFWHN